MARLPESIEVSIKDIPEVIAALEQAKALEVRHAALVAAAREVVAAWDMPEPQRLTVWRQREAALRAALDGEPS